MHDTSGDVLAGRCAHCDTPAEEGRVFCRNCGAALPSPVPFTESRAEGSRDTSIHKSLARKILVLALKGVAGIAALVAFFCPLSTFTEVAVFVVSAVIALICFFVLTSLDEIDVPGREKNGYWPEPVDWNPKPKTDHSSSASGKEP